MTLSLTTKFDDKTITSTNVPYLFSTCPCPRVHPKMMIASSHLVSPTAPQETWVSRLECCGKTTCLGERPDGAYIPSVALGEGSRVSSGHQTLSTYHGSVRWELQNFLDSFPQAIGDFPVRRGPVPNPQNIFAVTNAYNDTTDFAVGDTRKLPSNQCQHGFFPVPTGQTLPKPDNPFAALCVAGVFPRWFDSLAKEMIIRRCGQVIGTDQIVVRAPEFLNSLDSGDTLDRIFVCPALVPFLLFDIGVAGAFPSSHVPEAEAVVQCCTIHHLFKREVSILQRVAKN